MYTDVSSAEPAGVGETVDNITRNAPRSFDGTTTRATNWPGTRARAVSTIDCHVGGDASLVDESDWGARTTLIGESRLIIPRAWPGKTKLRPVIAHIAVSASVQMPTALCRSQITRFHDRVTSTVNARRHWPMP